MPFVILVTGERGCSFKHRKVVDGSEIRRSPADMVNTPTIYKGLDIPGGAGFIPSTASSLLKTGFNFLIFLNHQNPSQRIWPRGLFSSQEEVSSWLRTAKSPETPSGHEEKITLLGTKHIPLEKEHHLPE